ncbi:MAG: hypothetical protein ACJLUP_07645 [Agrobacterium tumefaciens]
MADDKNGEPPGRGHEPPSKGEGKSGLSKSDTRLTSLDQRILESAIRGAVPRLVGASHPDLVMSSAERRDAGGI